MSVGEERRRLGAERKLIFQNFCAAHQPPKPDIAEAFGRSVAEVERDIAFVAKKIREYRHRRCLQPHPDQGLLPPIPCDTEEDILLNSAALLWTLDFIGPETLSSELIIPTLATHNIESASDLRDAARAVRGRTREIA